MRRIAFVLMLVYFGIGFTALSHRVSATPTVPSCYDYHTGQTLPATKFLTSAGTLIGTSGNDVLVGSSGHDIIKGMGGNDVICSADFNTGDNSVSDDIDGGAGNDDIYGAGTIHGGSGNDFIVIVAGSAYGDSGNDYIQADGGTNADSGSGNDFISVNDGHAGQILAGSGEDTVDAPDGANFIDCGANLDQVEPGDTPKVVRCEGDYNRPS